MTDKRVYNFSAGPSQLPVEVLKEAADQMLNYKRLRNERNGDESSFLNIPKDF